MAKRAKASEPSEPESEAGTVRVEDPAVDSLPDVEERSEPAPAATAAPSHASSGPPPNAPPPVATAAPSGPSFGQRVGSLFRFLLRLVLLLIFLGLVSVALYLALPLLYDIFIRPSEQNAAQVRQLQTWRQETEQQMADLQSRLQSIETIQNQHDGSLTELDQRMNDIETEITARTESLAALERLQSELEEQNQAVSAELERQIDLLKAMELLSRARLSMYQSNFGLARQDLQIARDLLAGVEPNAPTSLAKDLDAVIFRLDLTLSNLPDFPVAASDDLDIAWQILLSGLPQPTPTLVASPTLVGTPSSTPTGFATFTPTPVGTITPTLPATVQPTATP